MSVLITLISIHLDKLTCVWHAMDAIKPGFGSTATSLLLYKCIGN